jgi:clusterin-associated protein 1
MPWQLVCLVQRAPPFPHTRARLPPAYRIQPGCTLRDDIRTETERVHFLQAAAQVALTQARLRLNLRRLYAADGSAVRELAKLVSLLATADQAASQADDAQVC